MSAIDLGKSNEFEQLTKYAIDIVVKASGNVFTKEHHSLIETKIKKRMMDLKIRSADEYFSYVKANSAAENQYFISEMTTHHTFFFREFRHFEYLQVHLQEIVDSVKKEGRNKIKILCLACSRGQEPYSLAMFFDHHLQQMKTSGIDFEIIGTDVDAASVDIASNGVYRFDDIKSIPMKYMANHWQRGKGEIAQYVKVKDSIKKKCSFRPGSILKLNEEFSEKFDIVFCRNVFIYFAEEQIKKIGEDVLKLLAPEGLFFTGVSESLSTMKLPISVHGPSIYSHPKVEQSSAPEVASKAVATPELVKEKQGYKALPDPLKILCVDDSKIILSLLKKIFSATPGYKVVGTAENGQEAETFLKNNDVDIMTLDIHMPIMDGLTYLKKNYNQDHPPVVIVSSVSREDAFKAMEGLRMGASDYIEKPSVEDFMIKGDEICTKLRVAALENMHGHSEVVFTDIDREFQAKELSNPGQNFYVMYAHYNSKKKIYHILKEIDHDKQWPATYLLLEGSYNILDSVIEQMKTELPRLKLEKIENKSYKNDPNTVYIGDFKSNVEGIYSFNQSKKSSMIVLGQHSEVATELLTKIKTPNLLLDDVNFSLSTSSKLQSLCVDSGPFTSFAYQAKYFLLKDE